MGISFEKITSFPRGILLQLLTDAYSFDCRYEQNFRTEWQEFDDFFFDNPQIADSCGFITTLDGEPIGFASWDPRKMPEHAEIGHNCIATKHKGNRYGRLQLQEAVNRITRHELRKIIVTTNDDLAPAQRMYESVGFKKRGNRNAPGVDFFGGLIDYECIL